MIDVAVSGAMPRCREHGLRPVLSQRRLTGWFQRVLMLAVACQLSTVVVAGHPTTFLLDIDFQDQPVDQPIGTGGAAAGQPEFVFPFLSAIVRDTPMASRSLDIAWAAPPSTGSSVIFGLLGGVEAASGQFVVEMELHPHVASGYSVSLREQGGSQRRFGGIQFMANGVIRVDDTTGSTVAMSDFVFGQTVHVLWNYDLDARRYDLFVDGHPVLTARPHGVPDDGRGIGAVHVGLDWNTPPETRLGVDNLRVQGFVDSIYANGFEAEP